jgi:hypothetical protein
VGLVPRRGRESGGVVEVGSNPASQRLRHNKQRPRTGGLLGEDVSVAGLPEPKKALISIGPEGVSQLDITRKEGCNIGRLDGYPLSRKISGLFEGEGVAVGLRELGEIPDLDARKLGGREEGVAQRHQVDPKDERHVIEPSSLLPIVSDGIDGVYPDAVPKNGVDASHPLANHPLTHACKCIEARLRGGR